MSEYLLEIKSTIDALISIDASVIDYDHMEAILNGLIEEYGPFMTTVISRVEPISVGEIKALLMAQEEMIERFKKPDNGRIHFLQKVIKINILDFIQDQDPTVFEEEDVDQAEVEDQDPLGLLVKCVAKLATLLSIASTYLTHNSVLSSKGMTLYPSHPPLLDQGRISQ